MALNITPVTNHREREKGVLVYPVFSRRSGGLSAGINLFPDKKRCSFDCPYCEVFPFSTNAVFSVEEMEADLRAALAAVSERNIPVKDICFSGNGEPSLSADFPEALERAGRVRAEIAPDAKLVLITNGTGLLDSRVFSLFKDAVGKASGSLSLDIWLKLDAGTAGWYGAMNRSAVPFEKLISKIKEFTACAPVTIQTMLCTVDGEGPPPGETQAWEQLVLDLVAIAANGTCGFAGGPAGGIRKVQIYGKARPAPEDPKAASLPVDYLEERAESLRRKLNSSFLITRSSFAVPQVEVYP